MVDKKQFLLDFCGVLVYYPATRFCVKNTVVRLTSFCPNENLVSRTARITTENKGY